MRVRHLVVATLAIATGALLFAAPAHAKGALSATITGPGLAAPLRLEVSDKTVIAFNALATAAMVDQITLGDARPTKTALAEQVGPAYQMTYDFGRSVEVRLIAYPLAEGGPLISVPAGQRRPFDNAAIPGGWLRGDSVLPLRMVNVGVPLALSSPTPRTSAAGVAVPQPAASTSNSASKPAMGIAVGLGALALGALAVWRLRRRNV
ncbi:MAG TPA: hypothetical protein VFC00_19515 [Micromonosporaceae bacterium]|nr:hypothetical protein [Micromonosporaceae bacterium]